MINVSSRVGATGVVGATHRPVGPFCFFLGKKRGFASGAAAGQRKRRPQEKIGAFFSCLYFFFREMADRAPAMEPGRSFSPPPPPSFLSPSSAARVRLFPRIWRQVGRGGQFGARLTFSRLALLGVGRHFAVGGDRRKGPSRRSGRKRDTTARRGRKRGRVPFCIRMCTLCIKKTKERTREKKGGDITARGREARAKVIERGSHIESAKRRPRAWPACAAMGDRSERRRRQCAPLRDEA